MQSIPDKVTAKINDIMNTLWQEMYYTIISIITLFIIAGCMIGLYKDLQNEYGYNLYKFRPRNNSV